jgi:hypothetical protein
MTSSSPKDASPSQNRDIDQREEDGWSGEDEEDVVGPDGSRKRKRPMSVSCEMCKTRKVIPIAWETCTHGIVADLLLSR